MLPHCVFRLLRRQDCEAFLVPLLARIAEGGFGEVILALPAMVNGATTGHYLDDRLAPTGVTVSRLAQGVPIGDVLGEGTLAAALRAQR